MLHIKLQLNKIIKSIAHNKKMLSVHIHNIKIMHVKILFIIIKMLHIMIKNVNFMITHNNNNNT